MRFIIHIGPRKTGTTYLQGALYLSRDAMAEEGTFYQIEPKHPTRPQLHRSPAGVALVEGRFHELAPEFYEAEARGMRTAVISDETLSLATLTKDMLRPLQKVVQDLAKGDEVIILSYCRRWSDRLPSLWSEVVKHGQTLSFAEWLLQTQLITTGTRHPNIDETAIWSIWTDMFGQDALRIVSYDVMMEKKANIAREFCDKFIGWQGEFPKRLAKITNQRLSSGELELVRLLNAMLLARKQNVLERAKLRLLRELAAAKETRFAALGQITGACNVRLDDRSAIFDRARDAMAKVAETALIPRDGDDRLIIPGISVTYLPNPALYADENLSLALRDAYARLIEVNDEIISTKS